MGECWQGLKKHQFSLDDLCDDCINRTCSMQIVPVQKQEWYGYLLDELSSTIAHHQAMAMEVVRDCWWNVGETITRVLATHAHDTSFDKIVQRVAHDLRQRHPDRGMSKRTFQYAVAFYRKFPNKDKIPQKSWKKIIAQDLTEQKALPANEHECEFEEVTIQQCSVCGKVLRE